jgi:predicted MPP superfamily phosphohydrolase
MHHIMNFEDSIYYHIFMKGFFRLLGIYEKGKRNALDVVLNEVAFSFPDLPEEFDGYRILFLTDLHLDGLDGLTERLMELLPAVEADLCIFGGDLRMETHGPFKDALARLDRLLPFIHARDGILGILGNHDCTEIIAPLEAMGIELLINEATAIERSGKKIWIVGVDDPHYYRCHDLAEAFRQVPPQDFSILVAHSNEIYEDAAGHGPRLYLCGHSHAGQIQIPPVGPIFTHSRAPRRYCHGTWEYGTMKGFTSCGVGVSGVPVRFGSRGEVAVITLKR